MRKKLTVRIELIKIDGDTAYIKVEGHEVTSDAYRIYELKDGWSLSLVFDSVDPQDLLDYIPSANADEV